MFLKCSLLPICGAVYYNLSCGHRALKKKTLTTSKKKKISLNRQT